MARKLWLIALLAACATFAAGADRVVVTIDASKTGAPIPKTAFGGFLEPATGRLWAEMLYDRKFYFPIDSKSELPPVPVWFRGLGENWRPVGPDEFIIMDATNPYVGEHTPLIRLESSTPHGISQSGLHVRTGKSYVGRIVLAGDDTAKVEVTLAWGPGAGERQTILISSLSGSYIKFPLRFTAGGDSDKARLEILGTGAGAFHVGAVSLMPADNTHGYRAGMIKLLKAEGITLARWPGGNFVSAYDWKDGLGDPDKRPPHYGPVWPMLESNDVGIDEFMVMCGLIGCEPYVAINSGFGEARSAAEEVEYFNGSADTPMGKLRAANGHPEPYNARYWGIGNEMYGDWQFGHMPLYEYWVKHALFTKAMKKVDPSIIVVASGATPEETSWCDVDIKSFQAADWNKAPLDPLPYEFGSVHDWSGGLLANAAESIDFIAEHFYSYPDLAFNPQTGKWADSQDPLELSVRRLPNKLVCKYLAWDYYLNKIPSLRTRNIKFAFDEWSARLRTVSREEEVDNMKSPLSTALTYNEMFRHSEMIGLAAFTEGFWTLTTDGTGEGVGYRVAGLVFKTFREHLCERLPVAVTGNSPQQQTKGTVGVDECPRPSGSPTYPLDVFAALSSDRKIMTLSVVNPTVSAQEFDLHFTGVELRGTGKLWQIAAPSVDSANVAGKQPAVEVVEMPVKSVSSSMKVPPISINMYEFEVK